MPSGEWLARLVPIYPGEGGAVWLCLAVNFLVFAGIMYGRNARDSLTASTARNAPWPFWVSKNAWEKWPF